MIEQRPYPSEHSARISDPGQYDEFRRENYKFGSGIHAIWGIKTKPKRIVELQSIRFDAKKFTVAEAKKWLKDHNYKPISFEPAAGEKTIKTGMLFRASKISEEGINKDERIVDISFSSEEPAERYFGTEILDHEEKSVRLKRLNTGGNLLVQHNIGDVVGIIEKAYISSDRKGRARVRFGKSARANEIFQDVVDGIRANISVGYQIHEMFLVNESEEQKTYRVMDWEPLEISLVSVPADITVGVNREKQGFETFETLVINKKGVKNMEEKKEHSEGVQLSSSSIDVEAVKAEAKKTEMQRVREIMAIGKRHNCPELAEKAVQEGKELDEFRQEVLENVYNAFQSLF